MPRRVVGDRIRDTVRMKIWSLFIRYYNEGEAFEELVYSCLDWCHYVPWDIESCTDFASGWELEELAPKYRTPIKEMLRWSTNPTDKELGRKCLAFLEEYGTRIRMGWPYAGNDPYGDAPILLDRPVEMRSVISPACRFLKDQIDLHDEEGTLWHKALPIAVCKRPGCGRLTLVKKDLKRGVLCSPSCKVKWRTLMSSREHNAKYMKDYRKTIDRHHPNGNRKSGSKQKTH